MKKFGNLLWGLVFIVLGIIFALNILGIANINVFFKGWWTLVIIIPSLIGFIKGPERMQDLVGLIIGIALLLCAQGILRFDMVIKLSVPFALIMLGLYFIFKDSINKKVTEKIKQLNKASLKEYAATFGESKINMQNEEFEGADLTAVFGSIDIDLQGAIIKKEQVINITAIFGGVQIKAPENVNVKVKSTSIFGGVENKANNSKQENVPTIYVNAFCMFGGAKIK